MANGKKTYTIEINGIQQSIDAVESLNKQLDALEKRISTISKGSVSVSAGGNTSALDEQAKMLKQIDELHQKVAASEKQEYQELLHAKEELKEYQTIAKSIAAQTNLDSGINNTNTMQGMKAQLHDIKAAMQTLDVDSDKFRQLQQDANELNNKLKEIEQGYGQFGRNVGNYAEGVAEGMSKVVINVGGASREFNNAREASRTLNMELKNMALNGQQNTKEYKELNKAVKQLNSTMADTKKSSVIMDNLLDTMQSFTAIGSVAKGFGALFGLDDDQLQKSIQQLMALQTAMQGIETLNQQLQSEEGIAGWLSKGNNMIDSFVAKLTGAGKAQKVLNTEMKAGKTAAEGLAAGETAAATATNAATVATKAFSLALKAIGIGLVITAISTLITYWKDIYKWLSDTVPVLKNLRTWFDKIRAVASGVGTAIANYMIQPIATLAKVVKSLIQGNFSDIPKIISEGLKKTYDIGGNYQKGYHKELERQQEAHDKKMKEEQRKANEEWLADEEAKYGTSHKRTQEYYKKQMALVEKGSKEYKEYQRKLWEDERKEREENQKKRTGKTKTTGKSEEDAVRQAQENINALTLRLMKDGLRKELAQLDENNRKEIEKIRKNGQKVEEQLLLQAEAYNQERKEILDKYKKDTDEILSDTTTKRIQTNIDKIDNRLDNLGKQMNVTFNEPLGTMDDLMKKLKEIGMTIDDWDFVGNAEAVRNTLFNGKFTANGELAKGLRSMYEELFVQMAGENEKVRQKLGEAFDVNPDDIIGIDVASIEKAYDEVFKRLIELRRQYGGTLDILSWSNEDENEAEKYGVTLATSLQHRTEITRGAYKDMIRLEQDYYKERADMQKYALDEEEQRIVDDINEKIDAEEKALEKLKTNATGVDEETVQATERRVKALYENLIATCEEYNQKRLKIEEDTNKDIAASDNKLFDQRLNDYNDFLQKFSKEMGKLPTLDKIGLTDVKGLKKSIGEITDATKLMRQYIETDIDQVNDDFRNGLIGEEDKNRIISNLSFVFGQIEELDQTLNDKLEDSKKRRRREIEEIAQILGQAAVQVIQSIGEIQDIAFDREMEDLDRRTKALEDQLDKQKELTEKYASDVDSIEDELSSARGDRRQHLIDQLNAQMQAQRESLAMEKKIEKEKEALEKKKNKLEYDNNVRKAKQGVITSLLNAALAISSAAVNSWPIPAIPMIAAATAVGAAQVAVAKAQLNAAKSAKYADGGVLQGKSHAQGGIKVLGGTAEVEGNEYITNKKTTMQNLDLLEFINSKKRKIDLSDFIDFYGNKSKVGKNIRNIGKTYFADGGVLPTTRTDIEINDRLVTAMEQYAEKPTVVSVVEIIDKMDSVNNVRTLAGINENE